MAAGLLPIVERFEPDRLADVMGRTRSLRPARGDQTDWDEIVNTMTTTALAMMVVLYYRPLAAQLLEPELHKIGGRRVLSAMDQGLAAPGRPGLDRPSRAVEQVEALPDYPAPGTDPEAAKNQVRIHVAKLLALHGTDRWQVLH